ncbi:M48 family metallopeptidase [Aeromonas caviae]|uniref:M48 family metallopeptidase n=1 Tax=Aeromonas TaxID=642 RepID=UPI00191F8BB7|nr:M48 family metallopeptidase [Aeromonas caviae]MBL0555274.1 M48 family metallopeptidase [Aeromonas caviae]MDH0306453.1 M48 family metallopeptidase [Aeromonas caviae]MDH1841980.1 M48 family metallopeptidase [Aeromonas caviae]MDU7777781.1 M48 family metallopeptidase [Aeromonas caviae]MDX7682476.1 M48 family metallopeptidase [Aeromonas caviae]
MRSSSLSRLALTALCSALLAGCAQSPTGRNQMLLFSPQQMNQLGADSFTQMKQQEKVSTDARMNAYVGCVAKAVTAQVPASYGITSWEVVVFDSKEINAFALPGGKIGVYSGLLKVAKNQDQLATVIGHELTHVLAQHSNERLSRDQLTGIGLAVADAAIGSSDSLGGAATMAALGLGVQVGIALPYGRTQESEADRLGLELMARAGFNPAEAVTLWQNMSAASGGKAPPQLLSTHPSDQSRIANLQAQQAEVQPLYQQAKASGLVPQCKA